MDKPRSRRQNLPLAIFLSAAGGFIVSLVLMGSWDLLGSAIMLAFGTTALVVGVWELIDVKSGKEIWLDITTEHLPLFVELHRKRYNADEEAIAHRIIAQELKTNFPNADDEFIHETIQFMNDTVVERNGTLWNGTFNEEVQKGLIQ